MTTTRLKELLQELLDEEQLLDQEFYRGRRMAFKLVLELLNDD